MSGDAKDRAKSAATNTQGLPNTPPKADQSCPSKETGRELAQRAEQRNAARPKDSEYTDDPLAPTESLKNADRIGMLAGDDDEPISFFHGTACQAASNIAHQGVKPVGEAGGKFFVFPEQAFWHLGPESAIDHFGDRAVAAAEEQQKGASGGKCVVEMKVRRGDFKKMLADGHASVGADGRVRFLPKGFDSLNQKLSQPGACTKMSWQKFTDRYPD